MSSKKRSTPSRKKPPAKSLEAIAPKRRTRVTKVVGGFFPDEDEDVPAIELPGRRPSPNPGPSSTPVAIPAEASADLRQALLAIEWAAARGMLLTHVQHGQATVGIASMGLPRGITADPGDRAATALYEQYGGEPLKRALARNDGPDEEDD